MVCLFIRPTSSTRNTAHRIQQTPSASNSTKYANIHVHARAISSTFRSGEEVQREVEREAREREAREREVHELTDEQALEFADACVDSTEEEGFGL